MTIFVGYPISYETACRLFGQPDETNMEVFVKGTGFELTYTDKGQYLLGLRVEAARFWDPFVDVDKAVTALLDAKRRVKELVQKNNLDLSDLPLQEMEGEEIPSKNPEPFVFSGGF